MKIEVLICLFLTVVIIGCGSATKYTNIFPARLLTQPTIKIYKDFSFNTSNYYTFSVVAASYLSDKANIGGILEQHMLFNLRNAFEEHGYTFVTMDKNPDFIVTVDGSAPYHEIKTDAVGVPIPKWVPGTHIAAHSQFRTDFNLNTIGDIQLMSWGVYSGNATTTIESPGHWTTETYVRPGKAGGVYCPSLTICLFDSKSLVNTWSAVAISTCKDADLRINSQDLVRAIMQQFPLCTATDTLPIGSGWLGIELSMYTNDGNDYYPTVIRVLSGKAAARAGVKYGDMITHVDGVPLHNIPLTQALSYMKFDKDKTINISLKRLDKGINLRIKTYKRSWKQTFTTRKIR